MRIAPRIAAVAILPLLAGCFDMTQEMTVAGDGTVTWVAETAMSVDMMAMVGADEEFCPTVPTDIPAGFTATVERTTRENNDTVCRMTSVGPLDQLQEAVATGALQPGGVDEDPPVITITNEGNGVYLFEFLLAVDEEQPAAPAAPGVPGGADPAAMATQMEAMILQAMEGRFLTWRVTAPRIIGTDATLEGNTVTFQLPLTIAMTDPGSKHSFFVRFALR